MTIFSPINTKNDSTFVDNRKRKSKFNTCWLCKQQRCAKWSCKKLQAYDGSILPKHNLSVRQKFGNKLIVTTEGIIEKRDNEDNCRVLDKMPKHVKAMVVHRRMEIKETVNDLLSIDNLAIEVTLLGKVGDPIENFEEVLYTPHSVYHWICKSKDSLVTHLL